MRVRYRHRIRSGEMDIDDVRIGDTVETPHGLGQVVTKHDSTVDVTARDGQAPGVFTTRIFTVPWREVTIMLDATDTRVPISTYRADKFILVSELVRQRHFEEAQRLASVDDRIYRLAAPNDLTPEDVAATLRDYPIALAQWAVPAVAEDVERVLGYRPRLESRPDVVVALRALKNDMRMSIGIARDKGYDLDDVADLKLGMARIDEALERMEEISDEEWTAVVEPLAMWRMDLADQLGKIKRAPPKPSSNPSSRMIEEVPERAGPPSMSLSPGSDDDEQIEVAPAPATSDSKPVTTRFRHAIMDAREHTGGSVQFVWAEIGMPVVTPSGASKTISEITEDRVLLTPVEGRGRAPASIALQLEDGYRGPRVRLNERDERALRERTQRWLPRRAGKTAQRLVVALSMNDIRKMVGDKSMPFAILTSWKDSLSKSMNQELFGELIADLQRDGYRYEKLRGQYFDAEGIKVAEKSVLIFDMTKADAQAYAAKFAQDSYIWKDAGGDAPIGCYKTDGSGVWWARSPDGDVLPARDAISVAPRDTRTPDLWSKGPQGSLSFEFPIDFAKLDPVEETLPKAAGAFEDIQYGGLRLVEEVKGLGSQLLASVEELAAFAPEPPLTPEDQEATVVFQNALEGVQGFLELRPALEAAVAAATRLK